MKELFSSKEKVFGVVRHVLTFAGGALVAKGLLDETLLTELIGGAITLAGTIWSIVDKNKN
jgi:hypothetical protein